MGTFRFEPSARLQRFLGRELIADPNVAVAEFVKNGYDAGASEVQVRFELLGETRETHSLVIADNGVGMDRESFERNWMRPGYSEKAQGAPSIAPAATRRDAARRARRRVPIGEKGVGRLAAGRLGERADVFTRLHPRDPWLHVLFIWSSFDKMTMAMNQIDVPYDETSVPGHLMPYTAGTVIAISDLSTDWRSRVPGRKVTGRSEHRLGRLKEDLSVLVQPLGGEEVEFQVLLESDNPTFQELNGVLEAGEPAWDAYRYDFSIDKNARGRVSVARALRRSADVATEVGKPVADAKQTELIGTNSLAGFEDDYRPQDLPCGPFSGFFLFSTVPWKRQNRKGVPPGIRLYRDGIRVPPYGDADDDWLGARARKASRQGYALQPESMWGQVHITKAANSALTDMSNRDGMVVNDAYEAFLQHVRAEFRVFSEVIETEWLPKDWLPKVERAAAAAANNAGYERAIAQLYVHRLRGPLGAVRVDVQSAVNLLEHVGDPELATRLRRYLTRANENIGRLDLEISGLIEFAGEDPPEPEEFDVRTAVRDAMAYAAPAAQSRDVKVDASLGGRRTVVLPRQVVVDAIGGAITNAAEAGRPPERQPGSIAIDISDGGRGVRVTVSDDGLGMTPARRDTLFSETRMDKGHAGRGLIGTRLSLRLYGADIACTRSGGDGTTFEIDLPTVGLQRKLGLI